MKDADKWRYGIVLDAGSSGTRSYVYRWLRNDLARQDSNRAINLPEIKTKDKWNKKVHVGLSTYAESPQLVGQDHLKPLIDDALSHVPSTLVAETPVFLLATAGMRLLPEHQREQVLDSVCTYLQTETNLLIPDCSLHIQVIPGATEGLYGWIAANYLVGGFDSPDEHDHGKDHHTYGFLDMGGASAQIAFAPNSTEAAKHSDNLTLLRLRNVDGDIQEHRIFVTTWLGFGINEARKQYLNNLLDSYPSDLLEYPDPCLPNGVRASLDSKSLLTAPGKEPSLLGTGQFDSCLRATLPLLKVNDPCHDDPCLFGQHVPLIDFDVNHFIGVSQYWHTTHEIFEMGFGENPFDLGTYEARVHDFCSLAWKDIQSAVAQKKYGKHIDEQSASSVCFKASWLISILHNGLGIETDIPNSTEDNAFLNPFTAVDTIKDTEVSWTLGKILLYASSTVPPASSYDTLPVGFGSNTGEAVPDDWVYPSIANDNPSFSSPPPSSPSSGSNGGITDKLPFIKSDSKHRIPGFIFIILILIFIVWAIRRRVSAHLFGTPPTEGRFAHLYSKPSAPGLLSRLPFIGRFLGHRRPFAPSSSSLPYHRLRNGDTEAGLEEGANSLLANPNDFELGDWSEGDLTPRPGTSQGDEAGIRRSRGKKASGSSSRSPSSKTPRTSTRYPYPGADIDRAGVVLRTESRESLPGLAGMGGHGLGLSGLSAAAGSAASVDGKQTVRSKSSSRAATPMQSMSMSSLSGNK